MVHVFFFLNLMHSLVFFFIFNFPRFLTLTHTFVFFLLNSLVLLLCVHADPHSSAVTALLLGPGSLIILTPKITPSLTFGRSHSSGPLAEYIQTFLHFWISDSVSCARLPCRWTRFHCRWSSVVVEMFRQQTGRWRMRPSLWFHRGLMMPVVTTGYSQPPNEGSCDTATRGPI